MSSVLPRPRTAGQWLAASLYWTAGCLGWATVLIVAVPALCPANAPLAATVLLLGLVPAHALLWKYGLLHLGALIQLAVHHAPWWLGLLCLLWWALLLGFQLLSLLVLVCQLPWTLNEGSYQQVWYT